MKVQDFFQQIFNILKNTFINKHKIHYKIDYIKKTQNGTITIYCKDLISNNIFAIQPSNLITIDFNKLEYFSTTDKIKIILMANNQPYQVEVNHTETTSIYFPLLAMLYSSCLIISNIIAQKLVLFYSITITASDFIYPLNLILGGIITDVYGYKKTRQLIWGTVIVNILALLSYKIAIYLPSSPYWIHQKSFEIVLDNSERIILSSMIAYAISEFCNSYLISKIKILTYGNLIWIRILLSGICAITIDNYLFMFLSYYGSLPLSELILSANIEYEFSACILIIFSPIFFIVSNKLKNIDKINIIDINTNFTPFSLEGGYDISNNMFSVKNATR